MTFVEAIKSSLSQYATFRGRATRSEYWFFVLFFSIGEIAAMVIDNVLGTDFKFLNPLSGVEESLTYGYVFLLFVLGTMLPSLSVCVRRLHDTNRSGWWFFIVLIPLVGTILILVWFCSKGTSGNNKYGSDPLSGAALTEDAGSA